MGEGVVREHLPAPRLPASGGYRYLLRAGALAEVFARHRPDAVFCGSPLVMPSLVRRAARLAGIDPVTLGFWHADFPRTYTGRAFAALHPRFEARGEALGWWWARREYRHFDATLIASRRVAQRMHERGLERLVYNPLGVDLERFHPGRRDPLKVAKLQAGDPRRRAIFFPHRFCAEKGLEVILAAYAQLEVELGAGEAGPPLPALVFAGTGPREAEVEAAVARFEHVHHLGYLDDPDELASWYASCDLGVSLSSWETFGLSTAEAMASGLVVIASDRGAAPDLVEDAGAGACVDAGDPMAVAAALRPWLEAADLELARRRVRARVEALTWEATFEGELALCRELLRLRAAGQSLAPVLQAAADLCEGGRTQGQAKRANATSSRAEEIHSRSRG